MPYSDPDKSRTYQREYHRMRRAGETCQTPCQTRLPGEFRLKSAQDVIALLGEQLDAVRDESEAGTLERARCIGYLAGIALKAIECGNMASRLEAMEIALKQRRSNGKP